MVLLPLLQRSLHVSACICDCWCSACPLLLILITAVSTCSCASIRVFTLLQVGEEVLGTAAKVEVSKESTTIVGDGSTEEAVKARVRQIRNLITETEQDYEKEKLNERVARLAGGVAIIQVRALAEYMVTCGCKSQCWGVILGRLGTSLTVVVQEGLWRHIIFHQIKCAPYTV